MVSEESSALSEATARLGRGKRTGLDTLGGLPVGGELASLQSGAGGRVSAGARVRMPGAGMRAGSRLASAVRERRLRSAFRSGKVIDLGDHAVPAEAVTDLVCGLVDPARAARAAQRLSRARITGTLDLTGAQLAVPLTFHRCTFDRPPDLTGMTAPNLRLQRCRLPGPNARLVELRGDLGVSDCDVTGPAVLRLGTNPAGSPSTRTASPMLLWTSGRVESCEVSLHRGVDLAGDVALQTADDVALGQAVCHPSCHVGVHSSPISAPVPAALGLDPSPDRDEQPQDRKDGPGCRAARRREGPSVTVTSNSRQHCVTPVGRAVGCLYASVPPPPTTSLPAGGVFGSTAA